METIYWITRLDEIHTFLEILISLSLTALVSCIIGAVISIGSDGDHYLKQCKKGIVISSILFLIALFSSIFIPTAKEALAIYGVGGMIDHIKNDSVATNIPDSTIVALDKFLDEYNKSNRDESKNTRKMGKSSINR